MLNRTLPSQTIYSIGYDFHAGNGTAGSGTNNGNAFGIINYKDTTHDRDQAFTYDALNRLTSAQNAGTNCSTMVLQNKTEYWGNSYGYDAWGNLLQKTITKCGAEHFSVTADAHNWIHSTAPDYQYDAAGNMTFDATAALSYTFDQENRLTGAAGYTYAYDADGNRVRKSNGNLAANGTLYWYMTPGVVAETDLAGTTKSEYIFFDGERVARRDDATGTGGVFYYFSDHLKTASVITDSAGVIKAESDYYPWGGELQFVNNDSNDYKFTGKKRDTETGLDYFGARYYSNGLGRWVSADWSSAPEPVPYADFDDPQSLNHYSYVVNNPVLHADSDGHAGKDQQLSGKFTVRLDKNNPNDMPNVHVKKNGNEIARGTVNPETHQIDWEVYKGKTLGANVRAEVQALAEEKGMFEAAAARAAQIQLQRAGGTGEGRGGRGGGRVLSGILNVLMVADVAIQEYNRYQFNKMEPHTGVTMNILGDLVITNLAKASQFCGAGSQIEHGGRMFTLDKDGHWKDKKGNELHQDKDDGHLYSDDERA